MDLDFSEDEIRRYSRHILLQEVGGIGQAKLKAARGLVIGAGGLGSPLVLYLAAAGIGTIGVVDDDPTRWARPSWPTSRIRPAWWRRVSIPRRCPSPTS